MNHNEACNRRDLLKTAAVGGVGIAAGRVVLPTARADEPHKIKGNIRQSICRWCYSKIPLDKLTQQATPMGYKSIELLSAAEIKTVKQLGLTCAVMGTAG